MPRFVIHRHFKYKRSHFDLMLEQSRGLKTWQIGTPSSYLDSIIPALSLPDHRRIYLDYEGKISCGRGSVKIVDQGSYSVKYRCKEFRVVVFNGKRLKGRYLFLMMSRAEPKEWLILRPLTKPHLNHAKAWRPMGVRL